MTRHPGVPPASDPASRAAEPPMAPSGPPVSFRDLYPRYPGYTPRRDGGLGAYETVLGRAGFAPVAGIDEAGRGACAGPLVVAAHDRVMKELSFELKDRYAISIPESDALLRLSLTPALRLRMNMVAPWVRTERDYEVQKTASDWGL